MSCSGLLLMFRVYFRNREKPYTAVNRQHRPDMCILASSRLVNVNANIVVFVNSLSTSRTPNVTSLTGGPPPRRVLTNDPYRYPGN